jgi:hypothetical protein
MHEEEKKEMWIESGKRDVWYKQMTFDTRNFLIFFSNEMKTKYYYQIKICTAENLIWLFGTLKYYYSADNLSNQVNKQTMYP